MDLKEFLQFTFDKIEWIIIALVILCLLGLYLTEKWSFIELCQHDCRMQGGITSYSDGYSCICTANVSAYLPSQRIIFPSIIPNPSLAPR